MEKSSESSTRWHVLFFLLDVASYALLSDNCVRVFFRLQTVMAEIEALAEV